MTSRSKLIRRLFAGLVFLALFIAVTGGTHYYLDLRLVHAPNWPSGFSSAIYLVMGSGFLALVVQGLARRRFGWVSTSLSWFAYSWLGFLFYLIIASVAFEIPGLLAVLALPELAEADPTLFARIRAVAIGTTALTASAIALYAGAQPPAIKQVALELAGWPSELDGFRIVQISDVHIGPLLDRRFSKAIVDRVNALEPDLIAVTGDLVDGSTESLRDEVAPFRDLRARHGIFFVTGNHDFYSGADSWVSLLEEFGWQALRNRRVTIKAEASESARAGFELAGVDDRHGAMVGGTGGEDLDLALEGWQGDEALVLLAHDPATFHRAHPRGVGLQLSGHTHGGQIWPFGWMVRASVPWVEGLHRIANSQLYVSSGTGFWGPPMRLGTRSEISELILSKARLES